MERNEIAIIGAGLGGLVAGLLLFKRGYDVHVYEQSSMFSRIGAGIQLGPNVLKIMRRIDLEPAVVGLGSKPNSWISRDGRNNALLADVALNPPRTDFGAAYVTIHRGDFHLLLVNAFPAARLHFNHRLLGLQERSGEVELNFEDQPSVSARIAIGADGVNSMVRETLLGPEEALYTGYVGHRAIFPAARLKDAGFEFDPCVKWWSEDRHLMLYYLDRRREEMYYVTGVPEPDWPHKASFVESSRREMQEAFAAYHPAVHALIEATDCVTKWPLLTRAPLELWSRGRIVLLGDACHPMKPHMAQGAAMAIEDAAMLVRCLEDTGKTEAFERGFALYAANRIQRASQVQAISNANTWLRAQENPDWLYGYDVFSVPLRAA
jgi:6-hydroxynicotinate 3-monooxygenase